METCRQSPRYLVIPERSMRYSTQLQDHVATRMPPQIAGIPSGCAGCGIWWHNTLRLCNVTKKMYSLFDSQYLWSKVTCSYNSCAEREWGIMGMCSKWLPSAAKQRRCRRTAGLTTAVSVSGVMAAHDASMVSRSAFSVAGFKFTPNTGNCWTCWWLSSKLILPLWL
jgi:hypothetical protein